MSTFQTLPGFREFYPDALARRNHIFRLWRQAARVFGFEEYDAPVLEPLELYKTKSGDEIEQQLFSFTDKGGREVALRPEMTPTVCRLVGARAATLKRPIKWFSIGEFYRYERPQKGRGRCFFQFNADIFGEPGPEAEIELIALLIQSFTSFGLTAEDFCVRLSDRDLWFFYLESLGFNDAQISELLSAIDKMEKMGDDAFKAFAERHGSLSDDKKQKIRDFLNVKSRSDIKKAFGPVGEGHTLPGTEKYTKRYHDWETLLDGLEAMGLGKFIQIDLSVVRGLAYYTGFVFEAFDRKGDLRALAGGGRYDNLVKKLGGPDLPAVGFAIGDVTTGILLEERGRMQNFINAPDAYVIIGAENLRKTAFSYIRELREQGWRVEYPLKWLAFGKQFKAAADSGARLALIFGGDELARGVVKLRDLAERKEWEAPLARAAAAAREFLAGGA